MKNFILIFIIVGMYLCGFVIGKAQAKHQQPERDYQTEWCNEAHGMMEVRIEGVRIDCLTDEYAVEVDFSHKWAEAIGQSLRYAQLTRRQPAVLLIVEKAGDERYAENIKAVNDYFLPLHKQIQIFFIKGY